ANSFTTVSLDPPLVLVCVDRTAVMHGSLVSAGHFGVSVLGSDQEEVARHFADSRRPLGIKQFDLVDWLPGPLTGAPLLTGALAHFEWRPRRGSDRAPAGRPLSRLASHGRSRPPVPRPVPAPGPGPRGVETTRQRPDRTAAATRSDRRPPGRTGPPGCAAPRGRRS